MPVGSDVPRFARALGRSGGVRGGGGAFLLACVTVVCFCLPGHAAPGGYPPRKATLSADWWPAGSMPYAGRAYHQMISHNGALYLIGGVSDGETYPVLRSTNGTTWTVPVATVPWFGRLGHAALSFNGKIWLFGGDDMSSTVTSEVWSSDDGVTWTQATSAAPWPPRIGFCALAHDGKMWVLGGLVLDSGTQTFQDVNDVWSSTDGVTWTQVSSGAPWQAREFFAAAAVGGEMFVMAGFADAGAVTKAGESHLSDVWRSADGVTWTQVTDAAPWSGRLAPACAVHDGKIWVMGGASETAASNDVWAGEYNTTDHTLTWQQYAAEAPWYNRAYAAAVSFNNRLWLSGGYTYEDAILADVWFYGDPLVPAQYQLTVAQSAGGAISVVPESADGLYSEGTVLTLTATPDPGYLFSAWTGDLGGNYETSASLLMDADKFVSAIFYRPSKYSLTILPTPGGTVTADPPEPDGGYAAGTQVTLQAAADDGYRFVRWIGAVQGAGAPTASLVMDDNYDAGALFALPPPPGNWYDPWAACFGQCPADSPDADGDGLTACREACIGTRDDAVDSDGDGMPDGWEAVRRLNPVAADADGDPDQDSMTNLEEFLARSDPRDPNSPVRTFFVGPGGTDGPGYGGPETPFQTLPFAVRAAAASEASLARVILFAGEYTADLLRLPRGLELRARDGDEVVIRGSLIGAGLCAVTGVTLRPASEKSAAVPPLLTMLDAVMKVDGVTFDGGETGLLTTGAAPARSVVESCTFTGMTLAGIRIFGAVPVIRRCLFVDIPGDAIELEPWDGEGAGQCVLGDSTNPNTGWNRFAIGSIGGRVIVNRRNAELLLQNNEWGTDSPGDIQGAIDAGDGPAPVVEPFLAQGSAILAASVFCSVVESGTQVPVTNATVTLQGSPYTPVTGNTSGVYTFAAVAPGTYTLVVNAQDRLPGQKAVTVTNGAPVSTSVPLSSVGPEGEGEIEGEGEGQPEGEGEGQPEGEGEGEPDGGKGCNGCGKDKSAPVSADELFVPALALLTLGAFSRRRGDG